MTERRRSSLWTTATLSLGAFLIVLALVAWQLHAGEDPALGGGNATQVPEKQVVVRRIVRRVIVTRVIPPAAPSPGLAAASGSSTSPAPASAPAAPAPAPAPPPAPVTRAS